MDKKNANVIANAVKQSPVSSTHRLLALCARAEGHPTFYTQLADQLRAFTAWDELPT